MSYRDHIFVNWFSLSFKNECFYTSTYFHHEKEAYQTKIYKSILSVEDIFILYIFILLIYFLRKTHLLFFFTPIEYMLQFCWRIFIPSSITDDQWTYYFMYFEWDYILSMCFYFLCFFQLSKLSLNIYVPPGSNPSKSRYKHYASR